MRAHILNILVIIASGLVVVLVAAAAANVSGHSLPCPAAIRTNIVSFRRELHFVCLQPTSPPRLDVIRYNGRQLVQSIQVDERGRPDKISSFVDDDGNLRIILAVPNRVNGTSLYSIDSNGNRLPEIHTVSTQYVDQLNTWKLELNLEWQLAIANQPEIEPNVLHGRAISQRMPPLPDPKPMISIYSWRSTYFDKYQLIYLPQDGRVSRLEPMYINGQEFLIVAMDSNRADKDSTFGVDSLIYKLDFGDGDLIWRESQRLPTRFALDVKPFYLTHRDSLQRDYYMAVLGRMKVTRDLHSTVGRRINVTDEEDGLIVYKYLGDEFVQTHAFPAQDMTKLETVTYGQGDTYVIMALLSEKTRQVSLLAFDGLTFQRLASPNMVPVRRHSPRQRRTMTNLQLFLAPPASGENVSSADGAGKRTLGDDDQQQQQSPLPMPVLSLSDPDLFHEDIANSPVAPTTTTTAKTAYQIPTSEIVSGTEPEPDETSPSKRDHIPKPREDLLGWCKATINSVLADNFDELSKQLLVLPRVDQARPIELNGDLLIEDDLHVSNLLHVSRLEEARPFNMQQQNVLIENNPSNFSHTFSEIQRVHREIDEVKRRVDQVLVDDGSDQSVYNQFMFDTLLVECHQPGFDPRSPYTINYNNRAPCPYVSDIRTTFLNGHNISNIQRQALLTGRSMIIERDVRFEHLVLFGSINIKGSLNGIPVSDIVFKRGFVGDPIVGHKDFRNGLYSQSELSVGGWGGLRVDQDRFLTSSGDQMIPSMRFTQVIIDSSLQSSSLNHSAHMERLNGLNLSQHLSQIALAGADNLFEGPLQFDELILNGPIHMVGDVARLSSVDLDDLWQHAMLKHAPQNISAPMEFVSQVHVPYGDIVVNGPVNGLWLREREVMMRDRNYNLSNPIIFDGDLDVGRLEALRALNGIQTLLNPDTGRQELAILYNEGNQHITGDKVLGSVGLGGRSTILGNINGHLNLSQLYSLANSYGQPHHFQKIKLTGHDIRIADQASMHISSTINAVPTNQLCSLAQRVHNQTSASYRSLRFEQPINFKSLRCSSVNGFTDLSSTFLTKYGNQQVLGELRLTNGAIFNTSLNIQSTMNELNIGLLARAISRSISETRTGHKEFYGDLQLEDLIADRINGLQLSSIFMAKADVPQIVRAPMIFDHLDIENVLKIGNLRTNFFNNLNVTDVMFNTLTYDTPQVIYNHLQLDTLQLLAGSNLQSPSVNGRNLRRVFSDAVLYDVPQQILAPKTFRGPVEFAERMYMRHRIDGLSFQDIRANLLLLSDDLIDGDLVLNNDCIIKKILEIQSKTINDIDLDSFVTDMIRDGQPLRVAANGSIRFHDVAAKDVVVGGTVQGVDLSREAIWRPKLPPQPAKQQLLPQQLIVAPAPTPAPASPNLYPSHPLQPPQAQQMPPPTALTGPVPIPSVQTDYNAIMKAHALADLSTRINRHLAYNFYYESIQKHPLLGPLMHYARDSLFLKATAKPGEPCLRRGQTVAIWSRERRQPPFRQTSIIQDTSNPRSISTVGDHLFILDQDQVPQLLVYTWDQKSSLYELQERLTLDGPALKIKAFMSGERVCLAVASLNSTIYCQPRLGAKFTERTSMSIPSVVDLDVEPIPGTSLAVLATISHQDTRQIGDLTVVVFDTQRRRLVVVATRKVFKPLKLHFFKNGLWSLDIQLALAEAITNSDNVQATSRIYSMRAPAGNDTDWHFHEVQEIRDNQFYDIQSVLLDETRSLLLFQSAHSISIYAPTTGPGYTAACDAQYALLLRIPTKGANKFLVFNQNDTTPSSPFNHYLVLTKDQCDEKQKFETIILKAQFK